MAESIDIYYTNKAILERHWFEDLTQRFLRKVIVLSELKEANEQVLIDNPYGSVLKWNEHSFQVILPSGLILTYSLQDDRWSFSALDRVFINACCEVASNSIILFKSADQYNFDRTSLVQVISSINHLWFSDEQILISYMIRATGLHLDIPIVSNIHKMRDFLQLVQEIINSGIEGKEIFSGIAMFPSFSAAREACNGISLLHRRIDLNDFRSLKSLLPVANGKDTLILITRGKIIGIGRIADLVTVEDCRIVYRGNIPGNPLYARFFGKGNCEIRGAIEGRSETFLTFSKGRPIIRDEQAIFTALFGCLSEYFPHIPPQRIRRFINLLMQLPLKKKGATFIIGDNFPNLVKSINVTTVSLETYVITRESSPRDLQEMFLSLTYTDGAVLLDRNLRLRAFGAILPVEAAEVPGSGGGARHTSATSYSSRYHNILCIVVSQDGPISVFNQGQQILSV